MIKQHDHVKGVKIRTTSYLMILIACVIYGFVLYETFHTSQKYQALTAATESYIRSQDAASTVSKASSFLTEQARLYVITANPEYIEAYFKEANETRSREISLETLHELEHHQDDDEVHVYLQTALQYSYKLMERELYAMKLVTIANGYDLNQFDPTLQECELSEEDLTISPAEQMEKAKNLVFDATYQDEKTLIESNLSYSTSSILSHTKGVQEASTESLRLQLGRLRISISILFLMNVIIFFIISLLIIKPLQIYVKCINDNRALEVVGSYEFKYLALTYNNIYELNAANEVMLRKKAERDALTGILNRGAFDQIKTSLKASPLPVALMLIDVDKFKEVNDGYGHEMGDKVLKQVANLLTSRFRTSDYVARIGGDEFAVILPDANDEALSAVADKVKDLNQLLLQGEGNMPPVSLSVGVALSHQGFDETLYKKADLALYQVKEAGRCGCSFYQDGLE